MRVRRNTENRICKFYSVIFMPNPIMYIPRIIDEVPTKNAFGAHIAIVMVFIVVYNNKDKRPTVGLDFVD